MRKGGSKAKGGSFENKIYKDLREILPDIKKTLGSGSSEDDADLVSDRYLFECKHHKELSWKQLDHFFIKLVHQCEKQNKIPVLIWKENNQPIMVNTLHKSEGVTLVISFYYDIFKTLLKLKNGNTTTN